MSNEKLTREDKRKFFDSAIKKQVTSLFQDETMTQRWLMTIIQVKVMLDNISGRGLDIPLLGLREGVRAMAMSDDIRF